MTEQYYQFYVNRLPAPMSVIKTDKMQHMAEMTRALWHTIKDKEIEDNGCTYYFMNNYMPIIIFVTKNSHTSPEKILTKYGVRSTL